MKAFVRAVGRLGDGELAVVRLTGFGRADAERQALVIGLLEDMEPLLKEETVVEVREDGDIEISRSAATAEAAMIDVSGRP